MTEPVQLVEIKQPFCANRFGLAPCFAGLGEVDTSGLTVRFSGGDGGYAGTNATVTEIAGAINVAATASDPQVALSGVSPGFSGDTFRYVVIHGKVNAAPATLEWRLYYGTASLDFDADRSMQASNLATKFRGVTLSAIQDGQEFVAVFDAADSTNYATDWQGETIDRLRFDLGTEDTTDFDLYSITVCEQDLSAMSDVACYNTRATCSFTSAYTLGDPLSLYFGRGDPAEQGLAPYVFPALYGVSSTPTRINMAGSSPDAQGLGTRALCNISVSDFQHTDRLVDPYVADRSWDPLDRERGSFWTRWMPRNEYRQNIEMVIYEGYAGQALGSMVTRTYFLDNVSPPSADGTMNITGKDILAKLEERKSQAPLASPGVLSAGLTAVATTFGVLNAVEADYPATGILRIGDEIVTYTGRSLGGETLTFTGVTRGQYNTTAVTHDLEDKVQSCLLITGSPDAVIAELLEDWAGIPASYLDTAAWATEVSTYASAYVVTGLITEPTAVTELVSQIQTQALVFIWWDEREAKVNMKTVRAVDTEPPLLTDEYNILEGSFQITPKPRERASQVWVYYNRSDFTEPTNASKSYASLQINANLESETDLLYGEPSIRTIHANWLSTGALAATTASKIITRYSTVPSECTFAMDAKDRTYWVGDTVRISHYLDRTETGERRIRNWTIVAAEEIVPGETVRYTAEDTTLYGRISYIMAGGSGDYPGEATVEFMSGYIGDASGLLSDGNDAARIT